VFDPAAHVAGVAGVAVAAALALLAPSAASGAGDAGMAQLGWLVAFILVALGVAGTVLPLLPGAPLVFLGLLVGAWADGFQKVGWVTLTLLALLALSSYAIDLWATHHGARRAGASPLAMAGALLGSLAGLFFSLPGVILGPFLGAFAGEYIARRDLRRAGRAGLGTWLGLVLAAAGHLALVFTMIGIFAAVYLLHS
jgi:uncharacterized protein YqgC (DUF456 family)